MIRIAIEWVLTHLGLFKREVCDATEALVDLLPVIFTSVLLTGVLESFGPFHVPWYIRLWCSFKHWFRKSRMVVVGY